MKDIGKAEKIDTTNWRTVNEYDDYVQHTREIWCVEDTRIVITQEDGEVVSVVLCRP